MVFMVFMIFMILNFLFIKERQRMKRFNEAFENLRQKLPNKELLVDTKDSGAGEKDTKV